MNIWFKEIYRLQRAGKIVVAGPTFETDLQTKQSGPNKQQPLSFPTGQRNLHASRPSGIAAAPWNSDESSSECEALYSLFSVLRTWPWLGSVCCRLLSRIFLTKSSRPNTWARLLSTAASTMHVSVINAHQGETISSLPDTGTVEKESNGNH